MVDMLMLAVFGLSAAAGATETAPSLRVEHAWVREAPPVSDVLAAYGNFCNSSNEAVTFRAPSGDAFSRVEMHTSVEAEGAVTMKRLERVTVGPDDCVSFEPGGRHLMLIGPRRTLRAGDAVTFTFSLSSGRQLIVDMPVRRSADVDSHDHGNAERSPRESHAVSDDKRVQEATAETVLDAFHKALEEGDAKAALQWLADDAVILEGGVAESKEEYAAHHLASDSAFLSAMQTERLSRVTRRAGGAMTVITRIRLSGTFNDRDVDLVSAETAVLLQTSKGWRIQHLHWSN